MSSASYPRPVQPAGDGTPEGTSVVDAMAEDTRLQLKMALWVVAIAVVTTLYFFLLNAWLLYKAQPEPYTLHFDHPPGVSADYGVFMQWEPGPGDAQHPTIHPKLLLNGSELSERSDRKVNVSVNDPPKVTIKIPNDTTGGEHRGTMMFERIDGAGPSSLQSPISLGIEASLWQNWFVVARWLVLVGIAYVLFYVFCLYYFPLASGTLNVWVPNSGRSTPRRVRMNPPLLRFLMPWIRGQQSLYKLLRRAKAPAMAVVPARIIFFSRGMPMMLPSRDARRKLLKSSADAEADAMPEVPPVEDRRRLGGIEIMSGFTAYSVGSEAESAFTVLRYKRP